MRTIIAKEIIDKIMISMEVLSIKPLSKDEQIKIILDKFNYNELSYFQRKSLLKEIKTFNKLKKNFNNTILDDVIEIISKIFKMPIIEFTLARPIKKNIPLILLQNIYGNNSDEKPNN